MQRYKVCHISSNFWDILHEYVTDGVINCRNVTNGMVVLQICIIFANNMDKGHKETVSIRIVSTAFMILAIAIFKPFGLEAGQWQSYLHLLCLFALGQLINTPLVALFICLYRHFAMSSLVESNRLSLSNYLETLAIIAFLSFAIGLYWRFKFRNKYLAMELEETRQLNEELKKMQIKASSNTSQGEDTDVIPSSSGDKTSPSLEGPEETLTLSGTTNESVTLHVSDLLYIEAVGNYVKVNHLRDQQVRTDMLRATMKQMEETLHHYPMIVRCHRAFLVNLGNVEQIVSHSGSIQLLIKHSHDSLPVSRSNMVHVKAAIQCVMHNA